MHLQPVLGTLAVPEARVSSAPVCLFFGSAAAGEVSRGLRWAPVGQRARRCQCAEKVAVALIVTDLLRPAASARAYRARRLFT